MILSAEEGQAMAGWSVLFALRSLQFIELGTCKEFGLVDLWKSKLMEGMFQNDKEELGPGTKTLMMIALDQLSQVFPGLIDLHNKEGEMRYVVREPSARFSALASAAKEISGTG